MDMGNVKLTKTEQKVLGFLTSTMQELPWQVEGSRNLHALNTLENKGLVKTERHRVGHWYSQNYPGPGAYIAIKAQVVEN